MHLEQLLLRSLEEVDHGTGVGHFEGVGAVVLGHFSALVINNKSTVKLPVVDLQTF